ncbi:MAG: hypothetical protein SGI87_10185 [Flavobacteriales bacterium]|nr:hypothetical protein [Flavobacteriales bacterium]
MKTSLLLIYFLIVASGFTQNTFQKYYSPPGTGAHCFGSYQLDDGGYIFTGIVSDGTDKIYLSRTDCEGNIIWSKTYNNSSTIGNISQRAIPLLSGGFCLAASIGSYNAYNILVVKTDNDGNTLWQKVMQGSGDDVVNSIIEAKNGDLIIAGHTNSFGQEAGSPYTDVYIARLNSEGNYLWGRSIGTEGNIDQAFDVYETNDSLIVAAGRYIEQGTFYSFIMQLDGEGELEYLRAYGDTNQYTSAYGIIECSGGGYAITGATTVMKDSYLDYPDEFIIRSNAQGDTIWTRTYHGTNSDGSENGSSIVELFNGYAIGVATMSYPTTGFVPNKHVILKTDFDGNLNKVFSYNNGGSHYPYITKPKDNIGVLLSGFTTNYSPISFKPILIRTDDALESGCNQTDRLSQTVMEYPHFLVREPAYAISSGGSFINSSVSAELLWTDSMICSNIVNPCNTASIGESTVETMSHEIYFDPISQCLRFYDFQEKVHLVQVFDITGKLLIYQRDNSPMYLPTTLSGVAIVQIQFHDRILSHKVHIIK